VEHVAEDQENNRADPQGCSRRGEGIIKIFTISELGDRGGSQKTITVLTLLRGPGRISPSSGHAPGSVA
jgi:hypothetical protein